MRVLIAVITGTAGRFAAQYLTEYQPQVDVFGYWRERVRGLAMEPASTR